jgi:membrane-associated protein
VASIVSGLTAALGHMSGWVAIVLIAVLVFGETAIFLGFVLPGEAAVVFGGVLASRGHLSLPVLIGVVVVTAVTGPLVGYEVGKRMGDRLFAARTLRRVSGPLERARIALRDKGGMAILGGRFLAIVRALMPAAAGAAEMPYRVFAINNLIGGVVWGVGYSLLGYLAGSAYGVVERTVGAGLAIAIAVIVVGAGAVWAWRRHRRVASSPVTEKSEELVVESLSVQAQAAGAQASDPGAMEPQAGDPHSGEPQACRGLD